MNAVELETEYGYGRRLLCPCGNDGYLHQTAVRVGWRQAEDTPIGVVVTTSKAVPEAVVVAAEVAGRRDAMQIDFWCEECAAPHYLSIVQHKGGTYLTWLEPPALRSPL